MFNLAEALSKSISIHHFVLNLSKKKNIVFSPLSYFTERERKIVCTALRKGTFTNLSLATLRDKHTLKSQQMEFGGLGPPCITLDAQAMVGFMPALDNITFASYPCDCQVVF